MSTPFNREALGEGFEYERGRGGFAARGRSAPFRSGPPPRPARPAPRYRPTDANAGLLRVRSRASFRTSRSRVPEGGRVVFSGRVGHQAARIPTGGKLIELQVRESLGRWNTVRQAFYTKSSGRFRLGYRFGKFYETNATFRFRLKVVHEQGWPYKAPVRSRPRAITVVAK